MVFAPAGPEVATALKFTIMAAVQRWLGDLIEVKALDVTSEATLQLLDNPTNNSATPTPTNMSTKSAVRDRSSFALTETRPARSNMSDSGH